MKLNVESVLNDKKSTKHDINGTENNISLWMYYYYIIYLYIWAAPATQPWVEEEEAVEDGWMSYNI